MISVTFRYPEDPDITAYLMYGEEFIQHYRAGGPGHVQVNKEAPILFDDIVCDLCNDSIERTDPCILVSSYLYCKKCMEDKMPYVVKDTVKMADPADTQALGYALMAILKRVEALRRYNETVDGVVQSERGEFVRFKEAVKCFEPGKATAS